MNYFVLDAAGNQYGPADEAILQQWAREGRLLPTTTLRDVASGQTLQASSVPGLFGSPYGPPPSAAPGYGSPYHPRPTGGVGNSADVFASYACGIIGIVFSFACSALVGLILGIVAYVLAKRASSGGNPSAQGAMYVSFAAIGLPAILLLLGLAASFAMPG